MRDRRHHNNTGRQQTRSGNLKSRVEALARRLRIPYKRISLQAPTREEEEALASLAGVYEQVFVGGKVYSGPYSHRLDTPEVRTARRFLQTQGYTFRHYTP